VTVVELALHESHEPGAVVSIQPLDLGRHGPVVPGGPAKRTP
jgi:hypothetical protein